VTGEISYAVCQTLFEKGCKTFIETIIKGGWDKCGSILTGSEANVESPSISFGEEFHTRRGSFLLIKEPFQYFSSGIFPGIMFYIKNLMVY